MNDKTVISMNSGIRQFSAGVQLAIRNPSVHGRPDFSVGEAGERLAALSLLADWIDDCEVMNLQRVKPARLIATPVFGRSDAEFIVGGLLPGADSVRGSGAVATPPLDAYSL